MRCSRSPIANQSDNAGNGNTGNRSEGSQRDTQTGKIVGRQRWKLACPSGLPAGDPAKDDSVKDDSVVGLLFLGRSFFGSPFFGPFGRLFLFLLLLEDYRLDADFR